MLLATMSNKEINREITQDFEVITGSSTLWRLKDEYNSERKRFKIKKEDDYTVFREFKTKSKNKWVTKISKRRSVRNYSNNEDSELLCFTYYYSNVGIRVFFRTESGLFSVFNGHLFTRYRERMNLEISASLELVKRLFTFNKDWNYMILPKEDDRQKFIGIIKEGFVLGDIIIEDNELVWFVHKTFVSRSAAGLRLNTTSNELIEIMKNNLIKEHEKDEPELYQDLLKLYQDFGLMENKEFDKDLELRMKNIVKEVQEKNMPETDFWMIQ